MKKMIIFFAYASLLITISDLNAQTMTKYEKWQIPTYFKGFNISDWNHVFDSEVSQQEFNELQATGANLAVIQTTGSLEAKPPYSSTIWYADGQDTTFYIEVLDNMIDYARNAGIHYVIAIRSGPGRIDVAEDDVDDPSTIWSNLSEQRLYASMVKQMISRYLPDSLFVGIDLTVEPNPRMDLSDEPPDVMADELLADGIDINTIYSLWIDSIRTLDNSLPIMVEGVGLADPEYFFITTKQDDPYVVYKVHCYNPAELSHAESSFSIDYPDYYWNNSFDDLKYYDKTFLRDTIYSHVNDFQISNDVPILLGEFGIQYPQTGGEQYLQDIAAIARELGWHFALWNINNGPQFYYQNLDEVHNTTYWSTILDFLDDSNFVTGIGNTDEDKNLMPVSFELFQNYPNPFNPTTSIQFRSMNTANIELSIFSTTGQLIKTLLSETVAQGAYNVIWDGTNISNQKVASGIYIYRLRTEKYTDTKKMLLIK